MNIFDRIEKMASENTLLDEQHLKKLKFDSISEREKTFKKKKTCIYPGCKNRSIKKSHTIQKSKSLKIISDSSFLLQPLLDEKNDYEIEMIMREVGIGDATTFPGFCEKHETLFASYENSGEISSLNEAYLQAYRSICRELIFNKNELENTRKNIVKYKNLRNAIALEKTKKDIVNPEKVQKITLEYDDTRLIGFRKIREKLEGKVKILENLHEILLNTITNKNNSKNSYLEVIEFDLVIPMALCGIGNAHLSDNKGNKRNILALLNIIPSQNSTYLILSGNIKDKDILEPYWKFSTQNFITILNCIESFMINATDHWFIKPQYWQKMNESKRKYILYDILATNKSFLEELNYSIFDDTREKIIAILEKQQTVLYQQNIEDLIIKEKKKLKFNFPIVENNLKELFLSKLF